MLIQSVFIIRRRQVQYVGPLENFFLKRAPQKRENILFRKQNKTNEWEKRPKKTNKPTWLAKLKNVYENTWYMKIHMYTHIWLKDQR